MVLISPMYISLHLWSMVKEIMHVISPMYISLHLWSMVKEIMHLISPMFISLYLWAMVKENMHLISPMYISLHLWSMVKEIMHLISPMYISLYLWAMVKENMHLISHMYRALHLWSMVGLRRRLEIRSRIWSTLQLSMLTLWWFSSMLCISRVCWSLNYWYNLIGVNSCILIRFSCAIYITANNFRKGGFLFFFKLLFDKIIFY